MQTSTFSLKASIVQYISKKIHKCYIKEYKVWKIMFSWLHTWASLHFSVCLNSLDQTQWQMDSINCPQTEMLSWPGPSLLHSRLDTDQAGYSLHFPHSISKEIYIKPAKRQSPRAWLIWFPICIVLASPKEVVVTAGDFIHIETKWSICKSFCNSKAKRLEILPT